jgi:hypothetical protein
MSVSCLPDICEIFEIKSFSGEFQSRRFCFSFGIQRRENPVIPAQPIVDVAHEIIAVFVDFVVVSVTAAVTAKFLVFTADDFFGTF